MALTDTAVRKAEARDKSYKIFDEKGLFLWVTTAGGKIWRFKYLYAGKEKLIVFGPYPEIKLVEARDMRDAARKLLRESRDPGVERKKQKFATLASSDITFEKVARDWHTAQESRWTKVHAKDVIDSLVKNIFPDLGGIPLRDIETPMVLDTLAKVERRGSIETAQRIRQRISAVFVYAIAKGIAIRDPAPANMLAAMKVRPKRTKQPALVGIEPLRKLLKDAEASTAHPVTKAASRLLALTAVRPGIITGAQWSEFEGFDVDSDKPAAEPIWRIPSARMKLKLAKKDEVAFEHIVPLPRQAVDVIRTIRKLTGRADYVFPNIRHSYKPMSANAIGYLYNRVGYHGQHVPHGWRAAFSTTMNELAKAEGRVEDRAVIDLMLAHVPTNKVEGAYNRAAYMPTRRAIAQSWADLITEGLIEPAAFLSAKTR
jgi:integrase